MKFIRAARSSGAPEGTSLHSLRRTYATQLKLAGRDLDDIRRLLGHGDFRMTQRYAKMLIGTKRMLGRVTASLQASASM